MQNETLELEYNIQKKNTLIAYFLLIILGIFGVHKFYLNQYAWGFLYPTSLIFGTILPGVVGFQLGAHDNLNLFNFSMLTLGFSFIIAFCVILIYDLLTLHRQVERYNQDVLNSLIAKNQIKNKSDGSTEKVEIDENDEAK